jgi:hypothetical protein
VVMKFRLLRKDFASKVKRLGNVIHRQVFV